MSVEETSVLSEHIIIVLAKKWQHNQLIKWQVKYADFLISMPRQCILFWFFHLNDIKLGHTGRDEIN